MASRVMLDAAPAASPLSELISALVKEMLGPTREDSNAGWRVKGKTFEFDGVTVDGTYELDARTKMRKGVNFDVTTADGTIRCGSSAREVAVLVAGIALGKKMAMAKKKGAK